MGSGAASVEYRVQGGEAVDNFSKKENFWLFTTMQVAYYELLAFLFWITLWDC